MIKTVKGRRYRYKQRTWREGNRVRTESVYLGALDGSTLRPRKQKVPNLLRKVADFIKANRTPPGTHIIDEEKMLKDYNARIAQEQQARQALLGELHDRYGLRVADTPRPIVETPEIPVATAAPAAPDAKESPSCSPEK